MACVQCYLQIVLLLLLSLLLLVMGGISNDVDDGCAMVTLLWLVLHKSKIQLDCSLYSFFISCFIIP